MLLGVRGAGAVPELIQGDWEQPFTALLRLLDKLLQFLTWFEETETETGPALPSTSCSLQSLSQIWSSVFAPVHQLTEALLPRFTTQLSPGVFCCVPPPSYSPFPVSSSWSTLCQQSWN